MKQFTGFLVLAVLLTLPALAVSPKRLETLQKRAAEEKKLIAFVVEQDYYDPNCPKCISIVGANNKQINRIAPNKGVIVIKLEKEDITKGDIPACVVKAAGLPRIVITDPTCSKVIDTVTVKADKARVAEMEAKISGALSEG